MFFLILVIIMITGQHNIKRERKKLKKHKTRIYTMKSGSTINIIIILTTSS